jgi:hypothetical protein
MESGSTCHWNLLKLASGDFAIQYSGDNPETEFPATLSGFYPQCLKSKVADEEMIARVENFYSEISVLSNVQPSLVPPETVHRVSSATNLAKLDRMELEMRQSSKLRQLNKPKAI